MQSNIADLQKILTWNRKQKMLSNITYLYKMMMGMGRNTRYQTSNTSKILMIGMGINTYYQTSNTSTIWWLEWEETYVIKDHVPLQIDSGNGKKLMQSKITYLYKVMLVMGRITSKQTSHVYTNWWWEWEETHVKNITYYYKLMMGMGRNTL